MKKPDKELKTPSYTLKAIKGYQAKTKEFRKRVLPHEFEKLLAYWKELVAKRNKQLAN